jgi:hypothetical protein
MNKSILIPISVVVGLIGAATIISKPWVTIQHAEPIMVKGYAEREVSADQGSLTVRISEKGAIMAKPTKKREHHSKQCGSLL